MTAWVGLSLAAVARDVADIGGAAVAGDRDRLMSLVEGMPEHRVRAALWLTAQAYSCAMESWGAALGAPPLALHQGTAAAMARLSEEWSRG